MDAIELQKLIRDTPDGGELTLPAGTIHGTLVINKSLTLVGAGPEHTTLDAAGRGPVIAVDGGDVTLKGLRITGGKGRSGGGVSVDNGARVQLIECHLVGNAASTGRGGGVNVDKGAVRLSRCHLLENRADEGGAIYVGGDAEGELEGCLLAQNSAERGGAVSVTDGANVLLENCRLDENHAARKGHHLFAYGSSARRPKILLVQVVFAEVSADGASIVNDSDFKAEIEVDGTVWPADSQNTAKVRRRRFTLH
jgi:hypothetical protein